MIPILNSILIIVFYAMRWTKLSCLSGPLELILFFEELEEREPPDIESGMNRLRATIHSVNFCMALIRLSGGFIFVITNTFSSC
jgi:hypothetical protein